MKGKLLLLTLYGILHQQLVLYFYASNFAKISDLETKVKEDNMSKICKNIKDSLHNFVNFVTNDQEVVRFGGKEGKRSHALFIENSIHRKLVMEEYLQDLEHTYYVQIQTTNPGTYTIFYLVYTGLRTTCNWLDM